MLKSKMKLYVINKQRIEQENKYNVERLAKIKPTIRFGVSQREYQGSIRKGKQLSKQCNIQKLPLKLGQPLDFQITSTPISKNSEELQFEYYAKILKESKLQRRKIASPWAQEENYDQDMQKDEFAVIYSKRIQEKQSKSINIIKGTHTLARSCKSTILPPVGLYEQNQLKKTVEHFPQLLSSIVKL